MKLILLLLAAALSSLAALLAPHALTTVKLGSGTATDTYAGICLSTWEPTTTYSIVPNITSSSPLGFNIICGQGYTLYCSGIVSSTMSPTLANLTCQ